MIRYREMNAPGSAGPAKAVAFERVSVPRLYFALLHQRFTGSLTLAQPEPNAGTRTVWFDGGMPVFTDWAEPTDVLGQVLMEMGIIGQEQLFAALASMANNGGLLGEQLVGQGLLEPATLAEGLRKQCFRKLVHTFALRAGQASLTPTSHDLRNFAKVNVLELIGIGIGAHYDLGRIEAELGPALRGPVQATAALTRYRSHFRFRPTDEPLLEALLGGTSFDELVGRGAPALRVGQLVYLLWACQMLRSGAAAQPAAAPSARPSPAPRPAPTAPSKPAAAASPAPSRPAPAAAKPAPPRASTPSPEARSGEAPTAEEGAFVTELESLEAKVAKNANAFALLGVPLTASRKDIRRAWADLSRRLHPDGLQARGLGHLRQRVSAVFAALSEAEGILGDKDKREELRAAIERGDDPAERADAVAKARAAFESELIAKEADKLLKANRFDQARTRYAQALELTPDEDDLRAAIAWCAYNLSDRGRENASQAERILADIVQSNPRLARAHYFRGHLLRDLGAIEAAIVSFEEALANDPRIIDAERQARALRLSRGRPASKGGATEEKKRGLKGLFSKR
jgi:curved DNA-binding protein CbpA